MKGKDDLFQLIKSMSKGEVRYFRLFSRKYDTKQENTMLGLFDALLKEEVYNEQIFKEEHKNEKWIKYLAAEKHRLYKFLLNALSSYFSYQHQNEPRILDLANQVDMLMGRNLPHQCDKLIKKMRKKSRERDSSLYWLIANLSDREITYNNYDLLTEKRMGRIIKEQRDVTERLYQNMTYSNLYDELYFTFVFKSKPAPLEELDEFMKHPFLQDERLAKYETGLFMFYATYALYYQLKNDHKAKYEIELKTLRLLEGNPDFLKRCMINFFALKGKELYITLILDRSSFPSKYSAYEKLPKQYAFEIDIQLFLLEIHQYQLLFAQAAQACLQTNAEELMQVAQKTREDLEKLENNSYEFIFVELLHYLAYGFLQVGDLDEARFWSDRIEHNIEIKGEKSSYLTISSQLILIFVLYGQQEYVYLKNKIDALKRYLKRNRVLDGYYNDLLKFLRLTLGKSPNKTVNKKIAQKIPELRKIEPPPQFDEVLLFNPLDWLEKSS